VDDRWKACGHSDTPGKLFRAAVSKSAALLHVDAPSSVLSLARAARGAQNAAFPVTFRRYEETINGREYRIEVSAVASDKWRAQIARAPGGSRAMMPFYGRTPDEAVEHLSHWLTLNRPRTTSQV
jgi:hypothetical protein